MTAPAAAAPLDDPVVRADIARMYVTESRDQRHLYIAEDRENRMLRISATWEAVRNQLAYCVAANVVDADGLIIGGVTHYGRDFAAAQIMTLRAKRRWHVAYIEKQIQRAVQG